MANKYYRYINTGALAGVTNQSLKALSPFGLTGGITGIRILSSAAITVKLKSDDNVLADLDAIDIPTTETSFSLVEDGKLRFRLDDILITGTATVKVYLESSKNVS